MPTIDINIKDSIIPMYDDVLEDILNHEHTRYIFPGGRGSTKSSFVGGIAIPLLIIKYPQIHAVCFRKIANTIQTSIFPQVQWGIYQLGLESLFHIPKVYSTPITYLPTGQQIMFMGLDDPMKVKSIKLPFGYIGITWFEELDQYSGQNELRTVTQSTMRGGDKFWDFRTFNPPISKNNWANEYTEECEMYPDDRIKVIRNTYLDVPKEWLGQEFLDEAEDLKRKNERAYIHEYMGVAIGTGGDVFQNVEDMDMENTMITLAYDADGNPLQQVPVMSTFDNIYNGIDWGFALDPFRFVRLHFDPRKLDLYIFDEYNTVKTRNEVVFHILYDELKKVSREELVTADSAEPKSIGDFKAYGAFIRGAYKGADSVRYGIKWLQGLNHIYIDKRRCPKTYLEFVNYEYEQDKDGTFISAYPDENNHCLVGNTIVNTPDGDFTIEELVGKVGVIYAYDLETGQKVETEFVNCRMTFEEAEIWEVELEDGRIIQCTYDHPILTRNRGYVMACELTEDDDVLTL